MAPGPDLEALLEEMRQQYENMNRRNHANTEKMFQEKVLVTCCIHLFKT